MSNSMEGPGKQPGSNKQTRREFLGNVVAWGTGAAATGALVGGLTFKAAQVKQAAAEREDLERHSRSVIGKVTNMADMSSKNGVFRDTGPATHMDIEVEGQRYFTRIPEGHEDEFKIGDMVKARLDMRDPNNVKIYNVEK